MTRLALLTTVLAACGSDHAVAIDAGVSVDALPSCTTTFEGDFATTSTDAADCAALDSGTLKFSIVQAPLAVPLTIAIDLNRGDRPVSTRRKRSRTGALSRTRKIRPAVAARASTVRVEVQRRPAVSLSN